MTTTAEYGLGPQTFPRGWFMVADAAELDGGRPLAVRFFGQDFALYRGKSGKVIMLDAYCPHMGTHLTKNTTSYVIQDGQVEGDSIRCPYHAWRFGPDGKCDHIPYYDGPIPKAAAVKSWPVEERMGCVFVWHDPEGGAPDYDCPALAEWDDPAWMRWEALDHMGTINSHPCEILDNMADLPHLTAMHGGARSAYFENEFDGHVVIQRQGMTSRQPGVPPDHVFGNLTWYTGPGVLLSRLLNQPTEGVIFIAHTPVDDGVTKVWQAVLSRSAGDCPTDAERAHAKERQAVLKWGIGQDFEIWSTKQPCLQVMQIPTDGPFDKVRTWYKQFYHPRAEVAAIQRQVNGIHRVRGMAGAPAMAAQ